MLGKAERAERGQRKRVQENDYTSLEIQ